MALKWKIRRIPSHSSGEEVAGSPPQQRTSITSRIAKAFSKSPEARVIVEQPGRLLSLPYELLEQILDEVESKSDLCNLRRTCFALSYYLDHRIFGDLLIDSVARGSHTTGQLLKSLASGKALFAPVVTTLCVANVFIFSATQSHNTWQDPNVQPLQDRYIPLAFKHLRNLKRVHWNVKIKDPYSMMADALANLPSLEELYVIFDHWVPTSVFPFDKFRNLSVLALEDGDYKLGLAYPTACAIKKAIQVSPNLNEFRIGSQIEFRPSLDELFSAEVPPTLTHLRALDSYWRTQGAFPASLTHVDMPNILESATWGAWSAFAASGTRLVSVTVEDVSPGLVQYLSGYSGLQVLRINRTGASLDEHTSDIGQKIFTHVLPRHASTLRTLWIQAAFRWSDVTDPFTLKQEYLDAILQCGELSELSVPFYYHSREGNRIVGPTILLPDLFDALKSLRQLRRLHLGLACAVSEGGMGLIMSNKQALLRDLLCMQFGSDFEQFQPRIEFFDDVFTVVQAGDGNRSNYCLKLHKDTI